MFSVNYCIILQNNTQHASAAVFCCGTCFAIPIILLFSVIPSRAFQVFSKKLQCGKKQLPIRYKIEPAVVIFLMPNPGAISEIANLLILATRKCSGNKWQQSGNKRKNRRFFGSIFRDIKKPKTLDTQGH